MNLKKLLKVVFVFVLLTFIGSTAFAQTTFFVNNQSGDDANPGTSALPKKSVGSALIAAPSGSVISVANTGVNYTEGNITISGKTYTFESSSGTPVFVNAAFNVGGAAAGPAITAVSAANPAIVTAAGHGLVSGDVVYIYGTGDASVDNLYWTVNVLSANTFSIPVDNTDGAEVAGTFRTKGAVTFTTPFQFNGGLNLYAGTLAGGNQVTVGTGVYRTELGSITAGQLNYSAALPFTYDDVVTGASSYTTGFELPVVTDRAGALNVNSTSGSVLTLILDQNRTVGNGNTVITSIAGNLIDLNTKTLNVVGNSTLHSLGGAVSNGTLKFSMDGAVAVAGAVGLPNVLATTTTAGIKLLTLAGTTAVSLTAQVEASITAAAMTVINSAGNATDVIINSGTGIITTTAATVHGNVVLNSTGLNATNEGQILLTNAGAVTVNGSVTNSANVSLADLGASNAGVIAFPDQIVTVSGSVVMSGTLSGSATALTNYTLNGEIRFGSTAALVTVGSVLNSATSSASGVTVGSTVQNNLRVLFASTLGNVVAAGGYSNSSSIGTVGAVTGSNGTIQFTGRTSGTVGTIAARTGLVSNTSTSAEVTNGIIDFGAAATGVFFGTSVTQGAVGAGGDISFGDHALNLSGNIINNRTATGADVIVPAGAAAVAHVISGSIQNNGKSNISIDLTGGDALTLTGALESTASATGKIEFPNAAAGGITVGSVNVVAGTVDVPATHAATFQINGAFNVSGGTVNLKANGLQIVSAKTILWTAGTLDFTGRTDVKISGAIQQIGGATTNPTFVGSAATDLEFLQPIPNVLQTITVGTADPIYPGTLTINNTAILPPPYVQFKSLGDAVAANLYILNDVLFGSSGQPGIVNVVQLDNVRLNIGKNGIGGGNGNFQNTSGYTTLRDGRVIMSGLNAVQFVNLLNPDAGATFGSFGVDNSRGLPGDEVIFFTPSPPPAGNNIAIFTGDFLLAEGDVSVANMQFSGTGPNWPTIFRTEGLFSGLPPIAASTMVNVTYYGTDKVTANELPAGATELNNLTVATTNGAVPGQGVVTMAAAATVNGTLTILAAQNLYTNTFILTLKGPAVVAGNLVDDGTARVQLGGTTAFTGGGKLPSLHVLAGSVNNSVIGFAGLVNDGFGGDNALAGGDDNFGVYNGNITYAGGAASSLTIGFTGVGPHFNNLTTAAGATLTLAANAVMSGNMTHPAGTIALVDFILDHRGIAPAMTGGALITSNAAGKLFFQTGNPVFTITAPAAVIGANFEFSGDAQIFTLAAGGADLTINGNLTLTDKSAVVGGATFDIGAGRTLTAGGANVTVAANCGFTAGAPATGILKLDATAPVTKVTYTTPAATNVTNLTIADNVDLAGGVAGSTLTVTAAFIHTGGELNIGTANLKINGTFTRTGGTYSGDGWLIYNGTGWNHGPVMVINNLEVDVALNITASATALTVNNNLWLNGAVLTQTAASVAYLVIGDVGGATVQVSGAGNISNAVGQVVSTFVGQTDYLFTLASSAPNDLTWPLNQATNVTVNTNVGAIVTVGASKNIAGDLTLLEGLLQWDSPVVVTLTKDGALITRDAGGALDKNADGLTPIGQFVAVNVNLAYTNAVGASGIEYSDPTTVTNINMRVGSSVTLSSARTVAGTLTLETLSPAGSSLTIGATTNWTLAQVIPALGTVTNNSTANWNAGLTVNGAYINTGTTNTIGGIAGIGTITNSWVMNLDSMNMTAGTLTLIGGSVVNLTGNGTMNNLTVPAVYNGFGTISTSADLTITGTYANTNLNLIFVGPNAQVVTIPTIPGGLLMENITLNKTADETVTINGGDITLNPFATTTLLGPPVVVLTQAAGLLTLSHGVLVIGRIDPTIPPSSTNSTLLTLNLTTVNGFITNLGYVRNPAPVTNLAHVKGRLGVAIPAGTIGRSEWPVGSDTKYRPVSLTFTSGNALISPTTIIVEHLDGTPDGSVNLDKLKMAKAPYSWRVLATTSLGASQKFDIELQGTNLNQPVKSVDSLRIIRRFDGDVSVNAWFMQGDPRKYSNILSTPNPLDTIVTVRNQDSQGGIVTQAAIFTIGVPVEFSTATVSGLVTYDNVAHSPLVGVTVTLTPGAYSATTDATGLFNIVNVPNGTYTLTVTTTKPWAGANATDALLTAQHFVGAVTLTGLKLAAADVNNSGGVNATDAQRILSRFVDNSVVFEKGNWIFETANVTTSGVNINQDLKGIAVGDVNGSNSPTLAKASTILAVDGTLKVNPKDMINLPIKAAIDMNISAMSLRFTYPADLVTFESVSSKVNGLIVNPEEGVITLAWADLSGKEALDLKADQALITFKFKPTENFKAGSKLDVTLDGNVSELAGKDGSVISATLKAAAVEAYVPTEFALKQNYPNPFNPSTTIQYELPVDSKVSVVIYNTLGEQVVTLVNQAQSAGVYKVNFNADNLTSGIYFYRLHVEAGERNFTQTQKMILMK
jgi:hypothetical protein